MLAVERYAGQRRQMPAVLGKQYARPGRDRRTRGAGRRAVGSTSAIGHAPGRRPWCLPYRRRDEEALSLERVKAVVPNLLPWQQLQHEVTRLNARIEELEAKLKTLTKE